MSINDPDLHRWYSGQTGNELDPKEGGEELEDQDQVSRLEIVRALMPVLLGGRKTTYLPMVGFLYPAAYQKCTGRQATQVDPPPGNTQLLTLQAGFPHRVTRFWAWNYDAANDVQVSWTGEEGTTDKITIVAASNWGDWVSLPGDTKFTMTALAGAPQCQLYIAGY